MTGCVTTKQLTNLHNPNQPKELERLDKIKNPLEEYAGQMMGDFVRSLERTRCRGRLPSELAVSRSFGDTASEQYGLIHVPDIDKYEVTLEKDEIAYILVGCDGVVETALKPENLGEIVYKNRDKSPGEIAEEIINQAFNGYNKNLVSLDNISVGLFQVSTQVGSLTVMDGHGGKCKGIDYNAGKLSQDIAQVFYPKLAAKINSVLSLQSAQQEKVGTSTSNPPQIDIRDKGKEKIVVNEENASPPTSSFTGEKEPTDKAPRENGLFGGSTQKTDNNIHTQKTKETRPASNLWSKPPSLDGDDSFCSLSKLKKGYCLMM